jgi:glucose/mannose-6-phosphate isomerase
MLDSDGHMKKLDSRDMLGMTAALPDHLMEGFRLGSRTSTDRSGFKEVVVCGLGGSAIGGDLACAWLSGSSETPCSVVRSYSLPAHVGADSLVIVVSYSGNTEETLSMTDHVMDMGATMIAISSGGRLQAIAGERDIPHCLMPSGLVPRATIGYVFGSLVGILQSAGVAEGASQVEGLVPVLERVRADCGPGSGTAENPAKRLAHELHKTIPVVIGNGLSVPIARRWANQLNENAKMIAFSDQLPEMNHNGIVGWVGDSLSQGFSMVFLEHDRCDDRMVRRLEATKAMVGGRMRVFSSLAIGDTDLDKMFSLVMMGDYVSLYSAFLKGVDPSTTEPIDELKRIIAKKGM